MDAGGHPLDGQGGPGQSVGEEGLVEEGSVFLEYLEFLGV